MKRTILLADDSPTIQRLVERTFEGSDFVVESVSNGEAAVRKLEELTPAAVLADIYMPGKNGYEVCTHVKQHPLHSETPVVLLVGAFEAFDEDEARGSGADTWITKPFEPKQLTETVSDLVLGASGRPEGEIAASPEVAASEDSAEEESVRIPVVETPQPVTSPVQAVSPVAVQGEASATDLDLQEDVRPEPVGGTEAAPDVDLLGLRELYPQAPVGEQRRALSEEEIEAIADRVIDRLSSEVVESIAWDIVPEVADRVMRDELKNKD